MVEWDKNFEAILDYARRKEEPMTNYGYEENPPQGDRNYPPYPDEETARIAEVQDVLIQALHNETESVSGYRGNKDIWVEGSLSELLEFVQSWRSEIEELG